MDSPQKEEAFNGICNMIDINRLDISPNNYVHLCDAIASWHLPPKNLDTRFAEIIRRLKSSYSYQQYLHTFPQPLISLLSHKYGP